MGGFGGALRVSALAFGLLASTSLAVAQSSGGAGGAAGGSAGGAASGAASGGATGGAATGAAPSTTTTPGTTPGTPPGAAGEAVGPGGTRIAPGASGADIHRQTVGPGGTQMAPGAAGTLGSGTAGPPGGASTQSSANCVPDTTGAPSSTSGATVGLGPRPRIISPEPGRAAEIAPESPSASGSGATLPRC